jgi:spore coat protein A
VGSAGCKFDWRNIFDVENKSGRRHNPRVFKSPQVAGLAFVERSRVLEARRPEGKTTLYCHGPCDCRRNWCPAWGAIPAACLIGCTGTGSTVSSFGTQEAGIVDSSGARDGTLRNDDAAGIGNRDGATDVSGGSRDGSTDSGGGPANDGSSGTHAIEAGGSMVGALPTATPAPPVLTPTSTDATTDYYNITVRAGTAQMKPGATTAIVGFNGVFPGPTIVATKGRTVQVTQTNAWSENITIHNHGHKAAASSDGHPIDYITPGSSKTYTYPNDQRAGTYWYHDHTMDLTGPHVYAGIAAFYLIRDPAEDSLNLPSGTYDVPLIIQDKQFNSDNSLRYDGTQISDGFLGDTAVVNGIVAAHFEVATHRYRFRILNGSNSRSYVLQLKSGGSFQVIASDGGLLAAPVTVHSLAVAPAERYDVVIDFGQYGMGSSETLVNGDRTSPVITDLLEFRITASTPDASAVPAQLSSIARYDSAQAVTTTQLTLARGANWTINGLTYDPARLDVTSSLSQVYIWSLVNFGGGRTHPFHKHLTEFQILDINGSPPPPEQSGWKDTVAVPNGATVRIIFRNETFTGTYVFHCHRLEHEDHRMMLQESVVP